MKLQAHGESGRSIDNSEAHLRHGRSECRDRGCGRAGRSDDSEISVTDSRPRDELGISGGQA